jgi:mRNA interferase RelE/StbE
VSFDVRLSAGAERYFARLGRSDQARLVERFTALGDDPFGSRLSKPLTNLGNLRSSRVGGLRILFTVDREENVVFVEKIAPRGQVYRRL